MIPVGLELDVSCCDEIAGRLSELLDGELDGKAAARVALHLAGCPACARFALELDATIHALHRLPRRRVSGPAS